MERKESLMGGSSESCRCSLLKNDNTLLKSELIIAVVFLRGGLAIGLPFERSSTPPPQGKSICSWFSVESESDSRRHQLARARGVSDFYGSTKELTR